MNPIGPLVMEIEQIVDFPLETEDESLLHWIDTSRATSDHQKQDPKYKLLYLDHQWADEAHTLQVYRTNEYFKTVE